MTTTTIHTPTNNLQNSLDFYQKLDFKRVDHTDLTLVTDGKALIEINPDRIARAGVKMYRKDWSSVVSSLEKVTNVIKIDDGFILSDPSGVRIYLSEKEIDIAFESADECFAVTGIYAGLSLETTNIEQSAKIWQILGLEKTMGDLEKGWVAYQNAEGFGVSLMKPMSCPHLFFNPSMTYFNGKNNVAIIQKIRDLGISIAEEITHFSKEGEVDNIIIRDPGGYGFFLFSD